MRTIEQLVADIDAAQVHNRAVALAKELALQIVKSETLRDDWDEVLAQVARLIGMAAEDGSEA